MADPPTTPAREDYPRTLDEFEQRFSSQAACEAYLCQLRWPNGFRCPSCEGERAWPTGRSGLLECANCHRQTSVTAGTIFEGTRKPLRMWFRAMWWVTNQKPGISAVGLQRALGLRSYQTAWAWLHKLRRAMVRPGRDRLSGRVEVDEIYVGGEESGVHGRQTETKALVAVAAEEVGTRIGRIRMRRIDDASAASLEPFIQASVEPGAVVHTDDWNGYTHVGTLGYVHEVTNLKQTGQAAHETMPRVHRVAALLKRWLLGTHQGAVSHEHLDYYLDEFTFRFNRRTSRSRGKLFYRLVQQAVAVDPVPYKRLIGGVDGSEPQDIGGT
jgi:transposase-like protein